MILSKRNLLIVILLAVGSAVAVYAVRAMDPQEDNEMIPKSVPTVTPTPLNASPTPAPSELVTDSTRTPSSNADHKLSTLQEIFASGNDNDPRLDGELRELAPADREKFRTLYRSLPVEKLNARGTIVFLLGRNLTATEDFKFFGDVLAEDPSKLPNAIPAGAVRVYPQLVALQALDALLVGGAESDTRARVLEIIKVGLKSSSPEVVSAAREVIQKQN